MAGGHVVMGLFFFPRGGSAYVARYLSHALAEAGRDVSLVSGSLGDAGPTARAETFFAGLDIHPLEYTTAVRGSEAEAGTLAARSPISFEDRDHESEVWLAAVDPTLAAALAAAWEPPFAAAGAGSADVFHLHHLTPQHDAVARWWPEVPVVAHLHGTEIKFVEAIAAQAASAARHEPQVEESTTSSSRGRHGAFWAAHLRAQAQAADHVVAVSARDRMSAVELLGVEPDRISVIPNGVDLDHFRPKALTGSERRALFRHWLVEDPRGWTEGGTPGSVAYRDDDLDRLLGDDDDSTVLIFVGRFTAAKRTPVLLRAFARARARFERPGALVVWGGSPGEWEGEHPVTVAAEVGSDGIFFAGWRGHDDLPDGLAASDALVMASVDDSYPQSPLEAMAVGRPVIATMSGGFPAMIDTDPAHPTGWLVPPDDVDALAEVLVEAVNHPDELARRGAYALAHARTHFSWNGLVPRFEDAYAAAIQHRASAGTRRKT
jgi:glycosyltransferase involved in cell wall biosynthesis